MGEDNVTLELYAPLQRRENAQLRNLVADHLRAGSIGSTAARDSHDTPTRNHLDQIVDTVAKSAWEFVSKLLQARDRSEDRTLDPCAPGALCIRLAEKLYRDELPLVNQPEQPRCRHISDAGATADNAGWALPALQALWLKLGSRIRMRPKRPLR